MRIYVGVAVIKRDGHGRIRVPRLGHLMKHLVKGNDTVVLTQVVHLCFEYRLRQTTIYRYTASTDAVVTQNREPRLGHTANARCVPTGHAAELNAASQCFRNTYPTESKQRLRSKPS